MRRIRRWRRRGAWALAVLFACLVLYSLFLYATLALPRGQDRQPIRIYGAAYPLTPGLKVDKARLRDRLDHIGYRRVNRKVKWPGEYRFVDGSWELYLRDFAYPDGLVKGRALRLVVQDDEIVQVLQLPEENEAGSVALEPQLVGGVLEHSRQVREWIPLSAMPDRIVDAVLAVEDHRFYDHLGIDPFAVLRAAWENLKGRGVVQGGSTITQQLAKNLYYSHHRTFLRKAREALAALILEIKYTKQDILESYLNEIYLGQSGSVAIYGIGEAAHYYFAKAPADLSIAEAALLAGMIKGPNTYAPVRDASRAKKRRDVVLLRLKQDGKISEKQYQAALATPIRAATLQKGMSDAPYFLDYVLSQIDDAALSAPLPGSRIFTTLDPEMQRIAEDVIRTGLKRLETKHRFLLSPERTLQASLVALDPKTGGVRALVGGRDYGASQFNRAVQARRQAGSLLKPFVYLAAMERGFDSGSKEPLMTPATLIEDSPINFPNGDGSWSPQNYDRKFHGTVTVRTALEQSLNVPAVRVAYTVGVPRIIELLHHLGIKGSLDEHLSLALGSSEVSLLEITGAYAAFANGGRFVPPTGLQVVASDKAGEVIAEGASEENQVFSSQGAYLITSSLKGVVERGTAAAAKGMGLAATVAGKTGTTDDHRDAWFIGYTSDLVIGVWVGFDDAAPIRLSAAQAALPIWVDFFRKAVATTSTDFAVPAGIVMRVIDPISGQLATSSCPESQEEVFLEGTEPKIFCEVHSPGFLEKLKRMFGM